jgi:hypothetical protein
MAKERNREKREAKAAQQAALERKKQRYSRMWVGAGIAAVVIAGVLAYSSYNEHRILAAVTTADYPAGLHTAGRITYKEDPPLGGQHNVVWQNCGIYDTPIHNEHAVHSMEHGAIWITYRPGLPSGQLETLRTLASDDFMLLSPYPGLRSPIVASAWNHQMTFTDASDGRLRTFIAEYKNNPQTTPEFGAPCAGGTSAPATADTLNAPPGQMPR